MARTRKFKTLAGLMKAADLRYLTATQMRNKRLFFPKTRQYQPFKLSDEAENVFWLGIAKVVWERNFRANANNLRYCRRFSLMDRLWYDGNSYVYCAGQDYPSEIRTIQRASRQF